MSLLGFIPAILSLALASNAASVADDPTTTCRRAALELAGAWANDGFRLRDSYWSGTLTPERPSIVRVNLLAGNRYWFTAAAAATAGQISVTVYNDKGVPVPAELHRDGARAAARVEPSSSGSYLVRVEQSQTSPAPFCLIYSYK
jgi:hypothetical protein